MEDKAGFVQELGELLAAHEIEVEGIMNWGYLA